MACPAPNRTLNSTTPTQAPPQVLLEPAQDERPLNLLPQAPADCSHGREQYCIASRVDELFERVLSHVVQPGREALHEAQHDDHQAETTMVSGTPRSASWRTARVPRNMSRGAPVQVQKPEDQADEHGRVQQQQAADVPQGETSSRLKRRVSGERDEVRQRNLRWEAPSRSRLRPSADTRSTGRLGGLAPPGGPVTLTGDTAATAASDEGLKRGCLARERSRRRGSTSGLYHTPTARRGIRGVRRLCSGRRNSIREEPAHLSTSCVRPKITAQYLVGGALTKPGSGAYLTPAARADHREAVSALPLEREGLFG